MPFVLNDVFIDLQTLNFKRQTLKTKITSHCLEDNKDIINYKGQGQIGL